VELIENESTAQGVLPEPEPRYHTASLPTEKTEHGQSIIQILAAVLAGLILIVLIVLLARWIYHKAHHASVATPTPSTSQKTPATSYNNHTSGAQPSSSSSSAPATNNPASSAPSNTQITNTGPGDVAAIFAGVTLAAAGLHYIISLRRFSRGQS
jgi:cytoskeletal protein RodZ